MNASNTDLLLATVYVVHSVSPGPRSAHIGELISMCITKRALKGLHGGNSVHDLTGQNRLVLFCHLASNVTPFSPIIRLVVYSREHAYDTRFFLQQVSSFISTTPFQYSSFCSQIF